MMNDQISKQDLFNLIEEITPLNNLYRDHIKGGEKGTETLLLMWKVGEILETFISEHKIKPHNLYWKIYGKAEGVRNSYITRDFLSYCLRIKKYFRESDTILKTFPHLQKYSLFREAFPLLENPKFKLSEKEDREIIQILNSNHPPKKIKEIIKRIKSNHIGIKNTRKQKLGEMKPVADSFVAIYNEVYSQIKNNNEKELEKLTNSVSKEYLVNLSQAVSALTQENLYVPEFELREDLPKDWHEFISNLKYLLGATVEVRNRFRRVFSPRKLFDFADMLNALTTDRGIVNYRKQKGISN